MTVLTHYYQHDRPFQSLSAMSDRSALEVISNLKDRNGLCYQRFERPENYLKLRRETERWLRTEFIRQGGKPKTDYPYYCVIGRSVWIEEGFNGLYHKIEIPIAAVESEQISFTYPDSLVSYWLKNQSSKEYYRSEYHGQVFLIDDILKLIDRVGIPHLEWKTEPTRKYDLFIEAQIWISDLRSIVNLEDNRSST